LARIAADGGQGGLVNEHAEHQCSDMMSGQHRWVSAM